MKLKEFFLNLLLSTIVVGLALTAVSWLAAHNIMGSVADPKHIYGVTQQEVTSWGWKFGTFLGFIVGLTFSTLRLLRKPKNRLSGEPAKM